MLDGKAHITQLLRSSDDEKKEQIKEYNNNLARKYNYKIFENSSYPGWKYKPGTKIERAYIEAYKEGHNFEEPIVCAIHAGVECGMIYIETTAEYLHFSVVAWAVVDLIRESGDNHVCIEVSGSWGSGKSSMVKMIGTELGYREEKVEKSDKKEKKTK